MVDLFQSLSERCGGFLGGGRGRGRSDELGSFFSLSTLSSRAGRSFFRRYGSISLPAGGFLRIILSISFSFLKKNLEKKSGFENYDPSKIMTPQKTKVSK